MKICKSCGAKNFDSDTECYKCKKSLSDDAFSTEISRAKKLIKIAMIVVTLLYVPALITSAIFWIISLSTSFTLGIIVWSSILFTLIPLFTVSAAMTNHYCRTVNAGGDVGLAFKICTFFFASAIAGFAMICDD